MAERRRPPLPVIVVALLLLAGGLGWWWWSTTQAQAVDPNRLSGSVEATAYTVAPAIGGRVTEVLVAEGGSTDRSRALLERYAAREPRLRWLDNPCQWMMCLMPWLKLA